MGKIEYLQNEVESKKERVIRGELAIKLLKYSILLIGIALCGSIMLIYFEKIDINNAITLILAVSTIFSGLLGSAITYYFSSNK